jgi:hypothetical protein
MAGASTLSRPSAGSRASAELAAVAVFAALAIAAWVERPGALLEIAAIALATAALWVAVAAEPRTASTLALVGLGFLIPLTGTWPGRIWSLAIGHVPTPFDALLAPATLLLTAVAILTLRLPRRGRTPRLLLVAVALLAAATVVSTLVAWSAASAGFTLLEFLVPIAIGALALRVRPPVEDGWLILTALLAGVCVPAIVGVAAYVMQLGFPLTPADLAQGKASLTSPLLFQQLTFGNVDHFSTLAVLLLPIAVIGATRRCAPAAERVIAAAAAVLLVAIVLLVMSRLALAAVILELLALTLVIARDRQRWGAVIVGASTVVLVALCLTGPIRLVFTGSIPPAETTISITPSAAPTPSSPGTTTTAPTSPGTTTTPTATTTTTTPAATTTTGTLAPSLAQVQIGVSAKFREGAIRVGLDTFRHHPLVGVGTGLYAPYDPVHTAPHSLLVQLLAENGIVGGAGLLVLLVYLGLALYRAVTSPTRSDSTELATACLIAAFVFLVTGIAGGVQLANGYTNVWPVAFALIVALAAGTEERDVPAR